MNNPLRGAIAGCGFFGQIHLEGWRRVTGAAVVAACDADLSRAQSSAPHAFTSLEQMLDEIRPDFLDIATRPEWHLPMLRAAAERNIPVICQKPMAPSLPECLEMVAIAEQAAIPFMIHENWRWQPWYRQIALQKEALGRPITYTFRTRKRDGAGAEPYQVQPYFRQMPRLIIFETLVHHMDTARFLFGDLDTVFARYRRVNEHIAGEDPAIIVLTHTSALTGIVDGNRYLDLAPDSPPLGDAFFEFEEGALSVHAGGDIYLHRSGEPPRLTWKNDVTAGYRGDSVRATIQHFIDCLIARTPFETSGRDYLLTVGAVEAAYRSGETGQAIAIAGLI
jgi:predicted dehydrogenase